MKRSLLLWIMMTGSALNGGASRLALAAAPAAPVAPSCGSGSSSTLTTPKPIRQVLLQPIGTQAFQLPNGATIDMGVDLQSILNTAVTSSGNFSPTDPAQVSPCNNHLELRSTVTNFQLSVADVGVTFGYTPSGSAGPVSSVTGSVNVNIGTISIDFSVWSCTGTQCSAIVASTATQLTAGVNLTATVNFTTATTSANFIYNTPLGDAVRSIMINGINQLAASSQVNELPWQAQVKEVDSSVGTLIFDQGFQSGLSTNQAFEVYAATDTTTTGGCNVFQVVADVHTTSADAVSSTALVDQMTDPSRGILVGDVVMIRTVSAK